MATIFEDNFNSYNDGDINGQGGWTKWAGRINVQGTTVKEGAKALQLAGGILYYKAGGTVNDGRLVVYMNSGNNNYNSVMHLREGTGTGAASRIIIHLNNTGTRTVDYKSSGAVVNIGTFTADTWFSVEVEWRSADKKSRYRFAEGDWTEWVNGHLAWTSGINQVLFETAANVATYVDYFAENLYVPVSASSSPSVSPSVSPSKSPSVSESVSPSVSPSTSESASPSVSESVSPSVSESVSPSVSESASESVSPSVSESVSPSVSESVSPSVSESVSPSTSESASESVSPSSSPSSSPSTSPSPGYQGYTRGDESNLPANDTDLETDYTEQELTDISAKNDTRVGQTATSEYAIHQYKDYVADGSCTLEWEGQTNCPPVLSTVYLQIYNRDTTEWETVDSDDSSDEDTDFSLTAYIADLTNYKDDNNVIVSRIYQQDV